MAVAGHLEQPTRGWMLHGVGHTSPLIWPCSDWGLPCRRRCRRRGGLLPHRFTLTTRLPGGRFVFCGPVRRLAAPRRYLAVYPMELGLSSSALRHPRPPRSTSPGRYLSLTQARQPALGLAHEPLERRIGRLPLVQ